MTLVKNLNSLQRQYKHLTFTLFVGTFQKHKKKKKMWLLWLIAASVLAAFAALIGRTFGKDTKPLRDLRAHFKTVLKRRQQEGEVLPRKKKPQAGPATVAPIPVAPPSEILERRERILSHNNAEQHLRRQHAQESVAAVVDDSAGSALDEDDERAPSVGDRSLYQLHMPKKMARNIYDLMGYVYDMVESESAGERGNVIDAGDDLLRSSGQVAAFYPRHLGDWNQRFQQATEAMAQIRNDNSVPLADRIRIGRDLVNLSQDFIHLSTLYGRLIISEAFLPEDQKTIKPHKTVGGLAGGEKYIVGNIMFKFALDAQGILGSDYAAAKVAGHELKGILAVYNSNISGFSVPLVTLVDYMGFRLIAMSILPISKRTIVYGSNDYGQTIHRQASDEAMQALQRLATHLNLKPHYCGINGKKPVKVFGPCDLEGHVGEDGRFYLVDFSRMMPPETPRPASVKSSHLFRLLRPEFVRTFSSPLCSDGYSSFIKAHGAAVHNRELARATLVLTTELIPQFAPEFTSSLQAEARVHGWMKGMALFRVSEQLHRRGINIRYLGLLRKHTAHNDVRTFLLIEIFSRVIKNLLRLLLREKMKLLRVPLEEPYRRLVIEYLNLLFGESDRSDEYWNTVIRKNVQANFPDALTAEEASDNFFLKPTLTFFSAEDVDGKYLLFCRIASMAGLKISAATRNDLEERPNSWAPRGNEPFDDVDLESIETRVKHMNVVNQTIGYNYMMQANDKFGRDPAAAERLLRLALARFQEALDSDVRNPETLCNLAVVSVRLLECSASGLSGHLLDEDDPSVMAIEGYFLRAVHECPKDEWTIRSRILCHYANFLEKIERHGEAEKQYLASLEADPLNDTCILDYGTFMQSRGEFDYAQRLFERLRNR